MSARGRPGSLLSCRPTGMHPGSGRGELSDSGGDRVFWPLGESKDDFAAEVVYRQYEARISRDGVGRGCAARRRRSDSRRAYHDASWKCNRLSGPKCQTPNKSHSSPRRFRKKQNTSLSRECLVLPGNVPQWMLIRNRARAGFSMNIPVKIAVPVPAGTSSTIA